MPESFDKMKTALMAEEVSAINSGMKMCIRDSLKVDLEALRP